MRVPGEVLCEVNQDEDGWILGRRLLEDGSVRLRVEREGTMLLVYAGNGEDKVV
jgi:hypothetical protein